MLTRVANAVEGREHAILDALDMEEVTFKQRHVAKLLKI